VLRTAAKPDWYLADQALAATIALAPGMRASGALWELHRSHLPLLNDGDARRIIMPSIRPDWAARNAATASRGFQLRNVQHSAIDFITQRRGTLLGDEQRIGKGHVVGTKILTPNGWCAVEALRPGDQVIGSNGRPCRVTNVFFRGRLPLFRVTFSDGVSLLVDGEHRWGTWTNNGWHRKEPMKVRSTLELLPVLRDGSENCVWRVPVVAPIDLPQRDLPLDPYLLGVLLGDGALSHSVEFTPGDDDVPREVERVLPPGVRLVRKASKTRAQAWAISGMRYHDNPVLTALRDLGLHGKLSHEKFVPEQYLFASIEQRQALLQGLMDTDGELHGKQKRFVGFSSSSLALVEAVRFLVESLGGLARFGVKLAPRYRHKGEIRIGRPSYRLTISMPDDISPFRARPGYQNRPKYKPARLIRSIEPEGAGEVVCISVDAPNQLYVTEHCIVTHNTLSMIMSHDPHDGPLVVICPAKDVGCLAGAWRYSGPATTWARLVLPGHEPRASATAAAYPFIVAVTPPISPAAPTQR
jgi:hypothetical protein